jgi:hypothetical protein
MQASGTGFGLAANQPVQLFVSYAHADRSFCLRLREQLSRLVRKGLIGVWYDRDLLPGDEWDARVKAALDEAWIVLLLISLEFLASENCAREMEIALERQKSAGVIVIPVPLTKRGWKNSGLHHLQAVPIPAVEDWRNDDEALADITTQLRNLIRRRPNTAAVSYAHFGPDAPLLVSRQSGVFGGGIGGIVGGVLAGLYIALSYRSANREAVSLPLFVATVLFVIFGGAFLGLAIHLSILWFRRLAIVNHYPAFLCNELVGALVGGVVSLGLAGVAAGALFEPYGGAVIDPEVVGPAVLGGAICIPIGILFYGVDRRRAPLLTSGLLALSIIIEGAIWYIVRPSIDLNRYCGNTGPWHCAEGGGLYLGELGLLAGFCIGLTVLLHRVFRQLKTRWRLQKSVPS